MDSKAFGQAPQLAFPHSETLADGVRGVAWGMTLRDYFAAKALQGLVARGGDEASAHAAKAYNYADAMMKKREAPKAPPAPMPDIETVG